MISEILLYNLSFFTVHNSIKYSTLCILKPTYIKSTYVKKLWNVHICYVRQTAIQILLMVFSQKNLKFKEKGEFCYTMGIQYSYLRGSLPSLSFTFFVNYTVKMGITPGGPEWVVQNAFWIHATTHDVTIEAELLLA